MVWPLDLNEPKKALSTMIVRENFYDHELAHKAALKLAEKIGDRERASELVQRLFAAIAALHRQSRRDDQPLRRLQPFIDRTFAVFDAIVAESEKTAVPEQ